MEIIVWRVLNYGLVERWEVVLDWKIGLQVLFVIYCIILRNKDLLPTKSSKYAIKRLIRPNSNTTQPEKSITKFFPTRNQNFSSFIK